jgi:hypothetical protein
MRKILHLNTVFSKLLFLLQEAYVNNDVERIQKIYDMPNGVQNKKNRSYGMRRAYHFMSTFATMNWSLVNLQPG